MTTLRYGYDTNGLFRHRLDDALTMIAEAGYDGVAITPDICHLDPYAPDIEAQTAKTARRLRELGLSCVVQTGAFYVIDAAQKHAPTLISPDPERRAVRMDFYDRCMRMAQTLGAECFTFWSGVRDPDVSEADARAWLLEGTRTVVEKCRMHGLAPAMEPEPEMMLATVGHYRTLAAQVPGLRLALDLGHCTVTQDVEAQDAVRTFGNDVAVVHFEDMQRGVHLHLFPGEGDMDLPACLRALRDVRYRGLTVVELSADAHRAPKMVRDAREWLRAHDEQVSTTRAAA